MVEYPSVRGVSSVRLEIYNDNKGVRPPRSYDVQYWNGNSWTAAPNQSKSPANPVAGTNTISFPTVRTTKIRVFFDHADPRNDDRNARIFSGVTEMTVR